MCLRDGDAAAETEEGEVEVEERGLRAVDLWAVVCESCASVNPASKNSIVPAKVQVAKTRGADESYCSRQAEGRK